jgi:hypothetical protein
MKILQHGATHLNLFEISLDILTEMRSLNHFGKSFEMNENLTTLISLSNSKLNSFEEHILLIPLLNSSILDINNGIKLINNSLKSASSISNNIPTKLKSIISSNNVHLNVSFQDMLENNNANFVNMLATLPTSEALHENNSTLVCFLNEMHKDIITEGNFEDHMASLLIKLNELLAAKSQDIIVSLINGMDNHFISFDNILNDLPHTEFFEAIPQTLQIMQLHDNYFNSIDFVSMNHNINDRLMQFPSLPLPIN